MPEAVPPRRRRRSSRVVPAPALRRRTREVVRASDPPTDPIPVWTQPDGVDLATGRAVVDLAVRAGIAFMATGAAAVDVVASVLRLTGAYGLRSVHVDVTFSAISVSYNRGPQADPLTVTRVVRGRSQDFTRLERLLALVDATVARPGRVSDVREQFDAVIRAPYPFRRWVVTSAVALMGVGTSILLGGGPVIVVTSLLSAALISRALLAANRAGVPGFFAQAIGAAIPTVLAGVLALLQASTGAFTGVQPSLVVASGVVVLLAGLSVVGAAQDAIEGFYVTAAARTFEVLVLTLGIVVGIIVVLTAMDRLGIALAISPQSSVAGGNVAQLVSAALIAAGWAVSSYASLRSTIVAAVAGVVGWGVYLLLTGGDGSPAFASGIAAAVIGVTSQLTPQLRRSALSVTTAAIVPLLPGRAVYQGLFEMVSSDDGSGVYQGLGTLAGAAGVGMGLAAGVSLGTYAARLAVRAVRRFRRPGRR